MGQDASVAHAWVTPQDSREPLSWEQRSRPWKPTAPSGMPSSLLSSFSTQSSDLLTTPQKQSYVAPSTLSAVLGSNFLGRTKNLILSGIVTNSGKDPPPLHLHHSLAELPQQEQRSWTPFLCSSFTCGHSVVTPCWPGLYPALGAPSDPTWTHSLGLTSERLPSGPMNSSCQDGFTPSVLGKGLLYLRIIQNGSTAHRGGRAPAS